MPLMSLIAHWLIYLLSTPITNCLKASRAPVQSLRLACWLRWERIGTDSSPPAMCNGSASHRSRSKVAKAAGCIIVGPARSFSNKRSTSSPSCRCRTPHGRGPTTSVSGIAATGIMRRCARWRTNGSGSSSVAGKNAGPTTSRNTWKLFAGTVRHWLNFWVDRLPQMSATSSRTRKRVPSCSSRP